MGAGCSSMLARRWRRSLRDSLCACGSKGNAGAKGREDDAYATGPGSALNGVVVMPLQNPPDVIEAHQR